VKDDMEQGVTRMERVHQGVIDGAIKGLDALLKLVGDDRMDVVLLSDHDRGIRWRCIREVFEGEQP
jgi:hypothetical protein